MNESKERRIGRPNGIKSMACGGFIFKDSNCKVQKLEAKELGGPNGRFETKPTVVFDSQINNMSTLLVPVEIAVE